MIDLNVRLDSSLTEDEYGYLCRSQNLNPKEVLPNPLTYNFVTATKEKYQAVREFALSLLQNEEAITFAISSLIHRLFNEGYYYLEIALTPVLHTKNGLSQRKVLKAALVGLNDALEKCPDIEANIVLYCHRQATEEENLETTKLALEFKDERVVALGLEGDDKDHPIGEYEKLFARCKKVDYQSLFKWESIIILITLFLRPLKLGQKELFPHIDLNIILRHLKS